MNGTTETTKAARAEGIERMSRKAPSLDQLEEWMAEGGAEATDGCWVEPDGHCEHGRPSWLIVLGMI